MRTLVLYIFLAACGGATTQPAVTLTPPPAQPVVVAPAAPTATVAMSQANATTPNRPTGIPGTKIRFEGGDGSDAKTAIVIRGASGETDGVAAEYKYLEMLHGTRGVDFKVGSQSLLQEGARSLDRLDVALKDGTSTHVFFDITEYFGKF